jgi:tetratricopeptide (TPR) repeat protein
MRAVLLTLALTALAFPACDRRSAREVKALSIELDRARRHRDVGSAESMARQILKRAPHHDGAWAALVEARLQMNDVAGAEKILSEWRAAERQAGTQLEEAIGDVALTRQDEQEAILHWQKALARDPKNERVLRKIAELEHVHRHWIEEDAAWSTLIKTRDSADPRLRRAVARRQLHRWDDAFADLQRARLLAPDNAQVQEWSQRFERLGKFLDEIRELDTSIGSSSADFTLLGDRALAFLRSDDPELALSDAEQARKLAIWAIRPKLLQAIALIELNRSNEGADLLVRNSIRLEQLSAENLEAFRRLDGQIAVERTNADLFVSRAWQLNEIGQPELAQEDAETALTLDKKSAGALAELSYALMKLGQSDEALTRIKLATDLDPQLAIAWQYRGEIEMTRGETVSAIDSLTHALQLNQTAIALRKRAECYRKIGYNDRAEEDLHALEDLTARAMK